MSELSIGEVARRTGIRPSALRYYEEVGLLPRVPRIGGRRRYSDRRDRWLLPALSVAEEGWIRLAAGSCRRELGFVRMAADLASHGDRAGVRRLRRRVCRNGDRLAMAR